jgi:hypothetical protein
MEKIPTSIRPYLDEIAQCLWSKNASIMIGAGFSMNAKAMFENAQRFPSWQDLGNVFYKKVRGEEIQKAKYNFFDPLKLAYEVESNFGRSVLDSILRTNIPDNDYKPSELHHSLLSLPWTDVFTTNYDTLLERTAESVSERNYKVVVHKDNLVHSVPPRIVKLHGCFSASTPLIISEEDYRTYPQKYAPFVNTVQQTLLENTLCLIGFSGDDPNFLKWIGWIRDNLGAQNAPKIYLIGVLNLSTSQEKSLAQYNITCVDMSLCDGINEHDHNDGIKRFINYCESRRDDESQKGWELSGKLRLSRLNSTNASNPDDVHSELTELIELWKDERLSYPNWLVAPNELRRKLWAYTNNWSSTFNKDNSIPPSLLKNFIYEFLWRKEKSLLPIFDNEVDLIKSSIKPDFSDDNITDNRTLYISLALLRYYREEGKKEDWQNLFNIVSRYFNGPNNSDYLTYERALNLLIENKSVELIQLLSRWSAGSSSAIWMYRKASILAEINKLTDAQDNLEKALIKTRRKINAATSVVDYANFSLESYILVLLTNVNHALSINAGDWSPKSKKEYLERLNELRQFQCNPLQEIQLLELEIKHEPMPFKSISVTNGFDIGSQHTTHHLSGDNTEALNAFRLLRFFEDAALPYSLPRMNIAVTGANNAIKRVATYAPHWSMSTMLRTRNKKSIELIFTRISLSRFDSAFIDGLAKRYIELLSTFVNEGNSLYEYGLMLPEALSRLCCRITLDVKDELLNLIAKIYSNKPTRHQYKSIDELVKRLILSYSDKEIIQRIEQITNIAYYVVVNDGKQVDQYICPNPFKYFLSVSDPTNNKHEVKLSNDQIKSFLNGLESDNKEVRQNASLTLIILKDLGLLNKNQIRSLLSKLLSDQDTYGLPENTGYHKFAFVELFESNIDIEKAFRKYLFDASPLTRANTNNPGSYDILNDLDIFTVELVGSSELINWCDDEVVFYARKLINWWQTDKINFENNDKDIDLFQERNNRLSSFVECLDIIIIQNNLTEYEDNIGQMVSEFEKLGLDYLCLKATVINYIKFDKDKFVKEIEDALSTFEEQQVQDALKAINKLLCKSVETDSRYLGLLAIFIKYSRGQYLTSAFQIVVNILKAQSSAFSPQLESSVLRVLNHVINGFKQLDFEENLALKRIAAKLSYELSLYYLANEKNVPSVISTWKTICKSDDEFSEIKNQWKN